MQSRLQKGIKMRTKSRTGKRPVPSNFSQTTEKKQSGFHSLTSRISIFLSREKDRIFLYSSFLIPFIAYWFTLPPGVTWGDSPEFANAAVSMGVSHPSGYPLFTLVCKIFSLLPFSEKAYGMNLSSALFQALAVFMVYRTTEFITKNALISFLSAMVLAFSYTWWYHGRIIEVYALQNFLVSLIIYFVVRYLRDENIRWIYFSCIAFGLAFTNHLTIVLFAPAMLFVLASKNWRENFHYRHLVKFTLIIGVFQILYLYIYWRASVAGSDTIIWNQPDTWSQFIYHVTGKEYSVFRKSASISSGVTRFINVLVKQFGPIVLGFAVLGALELFARSWRTAVFIIAVFLSYLIYNSSYNVMDIESYYLIQYMLITIALGVGIDWLWKVREVPIPALSYAIPLLVAFTAVSQIGSNWDLKYRDSIAHYFGHQSWKALPENSIMITDIDGPAFTMWYQAYSLHPADKSRVVITRAMYMEKQKKWYRDFLRKKYPDVIWPSEGAAYGNKLYDQLIELNYNKYKFYAATYYRVPFKNHVYLNQGWISNIVKHQEVSSQGIQPNKTLRWTYLTKIIRANRKEWYSGSFRKFKTNQEIGCVTEYINNHGGATLTWIIKSPDGKTYSKQTRKIPSSEPISAHKFKAKDYLIEGDWQCEVYENGRKVSVLPFTVGK